MADRISVAEALDRIDHHLLPSQPQRIVVDADAQSHILSAPVAAVADTPRFDCSAMDGFALLSRETLGATASAPVFLTRTEDIPAEAAPAALQPRTAAPISTGARIPEGADAVVAKEYCRVVSGVVELTESVAAGRNIRRRGEEVLAGSCVAAAGLPLSPALIGALLSYGVSHVEARRPPHIEIITTGSELIARPGHDSAARVDSNGPMIGAMCRSLGLPYRVTGPVRDDLPQLCHRLLSLGNDPQSDMLITTGGVSAGTHDLIREALDQIGARIIFHGIAMRPGKPFLFAILPDGRPFFGLPGNPVAALVGFRFFVLAAIRRTLGLPREAGQNISAPAPPRDGTTLFLRARTKAPPSGEVELLDDQRSHVLGSIIAANCWVRLDPTAEGAGALLFDQTPRLVP
jgi:molybdopterin molybdotransferase